eukprot:TRINITY_DN4616_c0_g1_i2.p1 TRINITY_DN4616_c0_g1~~TRINITY_DN4616_c0_g1_i2.p1  ORF type:complete len:250 (+),score=-10.45 TRINITY_DN4616_c0_g1_i2:723-1472(+)
MCYFQSQKLISHVASQLLCHAQITTPLFFEKNIEQQRFKGIQYQPIQKSTSKISKLQDCKFWFHYRMYLDKNSKYFTPFNRNITSINIFNINNTKQFTNEQPKISIKTQSISPFIHKKSKELINFPYKIKQNKQINKQQNKQINNWINNQLINQKILFSLRLHIKQSQFAVLLFNKMNPKQPNNKITGCYKINFTVTRHLEFYKKNQKITNKMHQQIFPSNMQCQDPGSRPKIHRHTDVTTKTYKNFQF